jgi:hypothetical protein
MISAPSADARTVSFGHHVIDTRGAARPAEHVGAACPEFGEQVATESGSEHPLVEPMARVPERGI